MDPELLELSHLFPVGMGETLSWERFPDGFLTAADN